MFNKTHMKTRKAPKPNIKNQITQLNSEQKTWTFHKGGYTSVQ